MLALLGLIVATIFSFSVTEKSLHFQRASVTQEIEEMGAAVGLRAMEVIREREYESEILHPADTVVTPPLNPETATIADLQGRLASPLPTGRACSVFGTGAYDCSDTSDFNDMVTATLPFIAGDDTLFFKVDVDVEYVEADLTPSVGVSFRKQVTVTVQDFWPKRNRTGVYIPDPITLSRVMTLTL